MPIYDGGLQLVEGRPDVGQARNAPIELGPAPMERRNRRSFDASQSLHRIGNRGVGIVDYVVASLFLS
jgi:hypothetical protein